MTPKPAYYTIKNLFEKTWHTEESLCTNEKGKTEFKGFYGKYEVEIQLGDKRVVKEVDLKKKNQNSFEMTFNKWKALEGRKRHNMKIRWIGQSGYVIRTDHTEIILDPYLSDSVGRIEGRPRMMEAPFAPQDIKADAVVCTHDHLDHLDGESIAQMDREILFLTTEEGSRRLKDMGLPNVKALKPGETVIVGDIQIKAVTAKHTVEAFGVILRAEGKTLYFSGDTLYDEKLFEIAQEKPDITFICINGRLGNMNVEEAADTARRIHAGVNVPNHYGMFASNTENPEKFTALVDNGFIMEYNREYIVDKSGGLVEEM